MKALLKERPLLLRDRDSFARVAKIAWPAMVESFFQAATVLIDGFMLSDLGYSAIAAVGLTAQPKFIAISPFIATSMAANALTARRLGQGKRKDAHSILLAVLLFACAGALLVGAVCAIFAE